MFVRVWRYRPRAAREAEFVRFYGSSGQWATLFSRATGYRGTDLRRTGNGEYETTDRWESRAAWQAFRTEFAGEYDALDLLGEELTEMEQVVSEHDEPPGRLA